MHTPFMDKSPHGHGRGSAGGRLKQRLAQILTRSSCTTNTTSANSGSATAFVSLAKASAADSSFSSSQLHLRQEAPPSPYFCTPCTYDYDRPKPDGGARSCRRRSRSASLVHISVDCTGGAGAASGRRSVRSDAPLLQHRPSAQQKRDVVKQQRRMPKPAARSPSASRRHCSSSSSASWGRARRPRSTPAPYSWSSTASSTATDDELAPSSATDDEEATLFSSLSLSSDSTSELYYRHTNARGGGNGNSNTRRRSPTHRSTARRRHAPRRAPPRRAGDHTAPPPDAFRPLVSVEAKKHREECSDERNKQEEEDKPMGAAAEERDQPGAGMAVVKRSSNPYLDFRSSMVEMVVERRIGSVGQMEDLLGSYLSLNSPRHHPAILAAFEDVWEAVFGDE